MKLRNKKTGEIVDYNPTLERWNGPSKEIKHYVSLAELNEEWEDYDDVEEEFWYVDTDCETYGVSRAFNQNNSDDVLFIKSIGNYFETKEEAEKAVEKLKAWKRLKDKRFKFKEWRVYADYDNTITFSECINYDDETTDDLNLLFGGEE